MIVIKNYIHQRLNLRILLNDEFNIGEQYSYGMNTSGGGVMGPYVNNGIMNNQFENQNFNNVKVVFKEL